MGHRRARRVLEDCFLRGVFFAYRLFSRVRKSVKYENNLRDDDDFIYFDHRGPWASPVETYLALSQLDKREREIAQSIQQNVIFAEFESDA